MKLSPFLARHWLVALLLVACGAAPSWGYVEAPYTLGRVCDESVHIVLVEVTRINRERGLIIYKKIKDLKGTYESDVMKHNIGTGQRGLNPREHVRIMAWAEVGKQAVFFCNEDACEMCLGDYWYQCYREEEWWGMEHGEPYLLRTYLGDPRHLADCVGEILDGQEVIVSCMADVNRERLHAGKGRIQRVKASLARRSFDPPRDFVAWGAEGDDVIDYQTDVLLAEGAAGWKHLAWHDAEALGDRWTHPEFDDSRWRTGKAPLGYGEDELDKRAGTHIPGLGRPVVFRRDVNVPANLLRQPEAAILLHIAAGHAAKVYLNGQLVLDDTDAEHDFAYWNHELDLKPSQLRPGRNVIAVYVAGSDESSDLFFDARLDVETQVRKSPATASKPKATLKR